ncbi:hypothetical protein CAEBREN_01058 [Caenorhabditis brenneri]|uniref:Uncharacterized protein n=1 Tax=Caenorhabditis brenneri TaxID=135651 RepID=G0N345_CAEBE|nr:hypothetical protein CAEBREN_01058 [Caenorhabditis brenneri]
MVAVTRFSQENICLIAKTLRKNMESVFCCQCLLDCRKNYRQGYISLKAPKGKKKKKRITHLERCCTNGCKNKADGIPPPITIAESYFCMECFAIDQERFGVDNTGFEDSDDKEFQVLKEKAVEKLKKGSVSKTKKKRKVKLKKCSTQGCQNIPPSKLLTHPKTKRYLCVVNSARSGSVRPDQDQSCQF